MKNVETWFVYMLECGDGSFYIGATNDLKKRVKVHNEGRGGSYTRSHLPVRLIYSESCASRGEAQQREYALKQLTREQKKALFV